MSDPYGLDPAFERIVAALCAQRPKFMGQLGYALEADALKNPAAQLIVKAALAIFKELGRGPSSVSVLTQRLRRWMQEGKVTKEELDDAVDLLVDAPIPLPEIEEVSNELAPVLQRRAQAGAIRAALDDFQNRRDLDQAQRALHAASRIGVNDNSLGMRLSPEVVDEIGKMRHTDKLSLGIPELDAAIAGGPPRGTETVIIGGYGAGKSMMLSHAAAYNGAQGFFVGYITLELPEPVVMARILSNLLPRYSINDIVESEKTQNKVKRKIARMYRSLGHIIVKEMPPLVSTMLDVRAWVKECEADVGTKMDVLVVDYADKLKSHRKEDRSVYDGAGTVYEDLRHFAHDGRRWALTASQARRAAGKDKQRRVEADDVADSVNKLRVADLVIPLTVDVEGETIRYLVGKYRYGKSGDEIGPLPHDWAHGRMIPGGMYETVISALKKNP